MQTKPTDRIIDAVRLFKRTGALDYLSQKVNTFSRFLY